LSREGAANAAYLRPRYIPAAAGQHDSSKEGGRARKRARVDPVESDSGYTLLPNHSVNLDISNAFRKIMYDTNFNEKTNSLISAAYANSTWKSFESAWNAFDQFTSSNGIVTKFPTDQKVVNEFINWLFFTKNLSSDTVLSYVSHMKTIQNLKCENTGSWDSFITKSIVKGTKSLQVITRPPKPTRKVMTLELLKILGHEISASDWKDDSKRIFWAAACTMFFGSLRGGEILSKYENSYNSWECLTWGKVKFLEDSILIMISLPKSRNKEGDFVDLFKFPDSSCCPVRCLNSLRKHSKFSKSDSNPVFMFENGKLLSMKVFNENLRILLSKRFGALSDSYSCHSFRPAIPSSVAKLPDSNTKEEIKWWGRWDSDCYSKYTRLKLDQRKFLFRKVCDSLLSRTAESHGRGGPGPARLRGQGGHV